jgi:hypothetical protein
VLHQTELQVLTCEVNPGYAAIAGHALATFAGRAQLIRADSRTFLEGILRGRDLSRAMFYLDAHWGPVVPLLDELRLILGTYRSFVVVIDDFSVPGDDGFGYGSYAQGVLEMEWIAPVLAEQADPVAVWYPSYASANETGWKRGMVILASSEYADRIDAAFVPGLLRKQERYTAHSDAENPTD